MSEKRVKGLTWRSFLAIIFGVLLLQPVSMYSSLVTGQSLSLYHWAVILLWVELARAFGSRMTKQELFIMSSIASLAITGGYTGIAIDLVKRMYIGTTPVAEATGVAKVIPQWWAPIPKIARDVYMTKLIFFHPAWIPVIIVTLVSIAIAVLIDISLGFFSYEIYVSVEKLDFPAATAQADTLVALSEGDPTRMRILYLSAIFGFFYGLFIGLLPTLGFSAGPVLGIDFTKYLVVSLPGATFAISSNLLDYLPGLILPLNVTIAQFVSAFLFYFVGTHLITRFGLWPAEAHPETITTWTITDITSRAQLYFYTSALIGLSLALAIVPFVMHPKTLIQAFKKLSQVSTGGLSRLNFFLLIFIGGSLANILIVHYLVPAFPIWILLLLTIGWSFFATFVSTHVSGVTFGGINIPYLKEFVIYTSGYQGRDIWFAQFGPYTGGSWIASMLKQADIVESDPMEFIKAYIIVIVLGLFSGFLWVMLFWYVQPIPGNAYPWTVYYWPVEALNFCRFQTWIWRGYLFRYNIIGMFFVLGALLYGVFDLIKYPSVIVASIAGIGLGIPLALAQLISSLFVRFIVLRYVKKEVFNRYKNLILIGFYIGSSIATMLPVGLNLLSRSMWLLPY